MSAQADLEVQSILGRLALRTNLNMSLGEDVNLPIVIKTSVPGNNKSKVKSKLDLTEEDVEEIVTPPGTPPPPKVVSEMPKLIAMRKFGPDGNPVEVYAKVELTENKGEQENMSAAAMMEKALKAGEGDGEGDKRSPKPRLKIEKINWDRDIENPFKDAIQDK